jgi:endonuclease/exonuclease/phosphatase family metal-dependent hydrolase
VPAAVAETGDVGDALVWMSINLKSGGTDVIPGAPLLRRHGSLDMDRLLAFHEIIGLSPLPSPDVIFVQEAKWWDLQGDELVHFIERQLRGAGYGKYRGFLTRSHRSHHHQVVFIDADRLQVVHHWKRDDRDESQGLYGYVEVIVDDDERRPVWLKSVHLDPRDGNSRLADARQLHAVVKSGQRAIAGGDWNSITSRRTEFQGEPQRRFDAMSAATRYGKGIWPPTLPGGDTGPETRALDYLLDVGWICQAIQDQNTTPTIAPGYDRGGELIIDRCLTYGRLRTVPGSVWVDESDLPYSDHRVVGGAITIVDDPDEDPS